MDLFQKRTFCTLPLFSALFLLLTGCNPETVVGVNNPDKTFTKLDTTGTPLTDQSVAWNFDDATASEGNFDRWSCVQDDETGLIWEIKTHDGGLRDFKWTYTWYDSNPATNGGEHGIGDLGLGVSTGLESARQGEIFPGSDNCPGGTRCDTEKYKEDVNAQTLCGASDWRVPSEAELVTIGYGVAGEIGGEAPSGPPYIYTDYFTDVQTYLDSGDTNGSVDFWTTESGETDKTLARTVSFGAGTINYTVKYTKDNIRLVRGTSN